MNSITQHLRKFLRSRMSISPDQVSLQEAISNDGVLRIQCLTFFTQVSVPSNKIKADFQTFLNDIAYPGRVVGVDIVGEKVEVYVKD